MAYVPFDYEPQDPDDLLTEALVRIQGRLPGWTPNESHVEYALLSEFVRLTLDTRLLASDVADAIFRAYGEKLIALPPQPGTPATANAVFTFTDAAVHTVPAGTQVLWPSSGEPILFATVTDVTNTDGSVTTPAVQIAAVEVGPDANGLATATLELVDAVSFVQSVSSTTTSTGGTAAEQDAEYLDRLSESLQLLRRIPVLARDFAVLARDTPGVHRALALDGLIPGTNEQQTVTVSSATGGTFTLTFEGQTTAALAHDASATAVRDALVALSNVGPDDVVVTGGPLGTAEATATFTGFLGAGNRTQMTATSSLTGTGAAVATATTVEGVADVTNSERTIAVAPLAEDGSAVPANVRNDLAALLDAEREANFVVRTLDPTYTTVTVTFKGVAEANADAAQVLADAVDAVKSYLSPANWAGGTERPPVWRYENTVRYLDVVTVIGAVQGMRSVTEVTLNGGTANVTLAGAAPLPAANAAVTGTVTS